MAVIDPETYCACRHEYYLHNNEGLCNRCPCLDFVLPRLCVCGHRDSDHESFGTRECLVRELYAPEQCGCHKFQVEKEQAIPKTEGSTPITITGADHDCVLRRCTIQTCDAMKTYMLAQGRITEVAEGKFQSEIPYGFDKIDPRVMFKVAEILEAGAKTYGINAWHNRPPVHHLNHAIAHAYSAIDDNPEDDENHYGNLICRAIFAYGVYLRNNGKLNDPC